MQLTKVLLVSVTLVSSTLAQDFYWNAGDGNGKIQWAPNCDFNGGDYAHYNVPAEQCGGKCLESNKCTYFTWGSGICWLKDARLWGFGPTSANGAVCGYKVLQSEPGAACGDYFDCYSSICAYWGATGNKGCCRNKPDGAAGVTMYAGYDYCKLVPNGVSCWTDSQCASGHCRGNAAGFKKGTCNW
ncbi:hypothetical protein BJ741DRAFT_678600 [Chytriomyces cf. hyalinus JEL632]|nr:hypothetical protein BJ741DRAFT_678600 [Chytriomyces cf. hyalinus JEL632]